MNRSKEIRICKQSFSRRHGKTPEAADPRQHQVHGEGQRRPLINRTLGQLDRLNLTRIIIVTGYEGQKLRDHIASLDVKTPICYIDNPIYDKTNNIYSLAWPASTWCGGHPAPGVRHHF